MKPLKKGIYLDDFFRSVKNAHMRILLLDYDGTIAPFCTEREKAVPYEGVREILHQIMDSSNSKIVVVSGRPIEDLKSLLGLKRMPELWGSHGWERLLEDGTYCLYSIGDSALDGLRKARSFLRDMNLHRFCEEKPAGIALHWRGLDKVRVREMLDKVEGHWSSLSHEYGLILCPFDGGIELRVPGKDKGFAVRTIISESQEGTPVAYLGDDLTDEDAFHALSPQGLGVLVRKKLRKTHADLWLKPPEELLLFLNMWSNACRQSRSVL